jgi:hypothetical protein
VYDDTMPSSHITSRMMKIVQSMLPPSSRRGTAAGPPRNLSAGGLLP